MSTDAKDYYEAERAMLWLDVEPTFDQQWEQWARVRPYAFLPDIAALVGALRPIDQVSLAVVGQELQRVYETNPGYNGVIDRQRMTAEQIRLIIPQTKLDALTPVRLDKALAAVYAVNRALERIKAPMVRPRIVLSAFNIKGVSKIFSALDKDKKERVKRALAEALSQADQLASEFLKGNKVSIDAAIQAHAFLITQSDFKATIDHRVAVALETPSHKHAKAALSEDFSSGRLNQLPAPFKRPKGYTSPKAGNA